MHKNNDVPDHRIFQLIHKNIQSLARLAEGMTFASNEIKEYKSILKFLRWCYKNHRTLLSDGMIAKIQKLELIIQKKHNCSPPGMEELSDLKKLPPLEDMLDEMLRNKNKLTKNELFWVKTIDHTAADFEYREDLTRRQAAVIIDIYRRFKER